MLGRCVKDKLRVTVPPQLAYGDEGKGEEIPGGSTLVFEILIMDARAQDGGTDQAGFIKL